MEENEKKEKKEQEKQEEQEDMKLEAELEKASPTSPAGSNFSDFPPNVSDILPNIDF